jgi:hypothetical protein
MRPEEAVIYALFLVRQFDGSPHYTSANNAYHRAEHKIRHEEGRRAHQQAECRYPLPPIRAHEVLEADNPHETHAYNKRGEQP